MYNFNADENATRKSLICGYFYLGTWNEWVKYSCNYHYVYFAIIYMPYRLIHQRPIHIVNIVILITFG